MSDIVKVLKNYSKAIGVTELEALKLLINHNDKFARLVIKELKKVTKIK